MKNINFGILKSRNARRVVYLSKISAIKIISRHLPILGINKKIRNILCDQINENNYKNEVSFVSVEMQPHNNEKIIIIKGSIKIELDSDTPYQSIEPLLKYHLA